MKRVLKATTAGKGDDGLPSKARFVTEPAAAEAARRDVTAMLGRFPLYPELTI